MRQALATLAIQISAFKLGMFALLLGQLAGKVLARKNLHGQHFLTRGLAKLAGVVLLLRRDDTQVSNFFNLGCHFQ